MEFISVPSLNLFPNDGGNFYPVKSRNFYLVISSMCARTRLSIFFEFCQLASSSLEGT